MYYPMIYKIILLCLSFIGIRSQTVNRFSLPGDLVSVSGDGNVMVIIDTIYGGGMTILRRAGLIFEQIKVRNWENVWIPSTGYENLLKFEHSKFYKPQLCYNGSYMYYVSSITGRVVVGYIYATSAHNPYITEDHLWNYACETVRKSCRFTLHTEQWMSFVNIGQRKATVLKNGKPWHFQIYNLNFNSSPCGWINQMILQPFQIQFYPSSSELGMKIRYNGIFCYVQFWINPIFINIYPYNNYLDNFCNSNLQITLFCLPKSAKIGLDLSVEWRNGEWVTIQSFKTVNWAGQTTFLRSDQKYLGFVLTQYRNLYAILAYSKGLYHLYLHQFSSNKKYELNIIDRDQIKSFDLNSDGTTVVYVNSFHETVVINHELGVQQTVYYCQNVNSYFRYFEDCSNINSIVWVSFGLILLLLLILFILFVYFCCKYRQFRKKQQSQIKNQIKIENNSKQIEVQPNQKIKQKMQNTVVELVLEPRTINDQYKD